MCSAVLPEQGFSVVRQTGRSAAEIVREPEPSRSIHRPEDGAGGKVPGVGIARLLCVVVRCGHGWRSTILALWNAFEN